MFFHERLKLLREERGLTQAQVSAAVNIANRQYQRYESGEQDITQKRLLVLADFFEVSVDYLTGQSDIREKR